MYPVSSISPYYFTGVTARAQISPQDSTYDLLKVQSGHDLFITGDPRNPQKVITNLNKIPYNAIEVLQVDKGSRVVVAAKESDRLPESLKLNLLA
jgi:hypothetical protein